MNIGSGSAIRPQIYNFLPSLPNILQKNALPVGSLIEGHSLAGGRMGEGEMGGVKVEAVGWGAVEVVALDRASEAFGMGGMDAQLMGATRLWIEVQEGGAVGCADDVVVGDGLLAVLVVDHLPWTVEGVGKEGKGDGA